MNDRLVIAGIGLSSSLGVRSVEHVVFARAGLPEPSPIVFRRKDDDKPVRARWARWLGPALSLEQRLATLAEHAVKEALTGLSDDDASALHVRVAMDESTTADARRHVVDSLRALTHARSIDVAADRASAFAWLEAALQEGVRPTLLVGVDSLVALESIDALLGRPSSPWARAPLAPGEGAGALLVMSEHDARSCRLGVLATVLDARTAPGRGTERDDQLVEGEATTWLLSNVRTEGPIRLTFGSFSTDDLRAREWHLGTARNAARFAGTGYGASIENLVGRVRAAASAMTLAHAVSAVRHGDGVAADERTCNAIAWGMDGDGLRGVASLRVRREARS